MQEQLLVFDEIFEECTVALTAVLHYKLFLYG